MPGRAPVAVENGKLGASTPASNLTLARGTGEAPPPPLPVAAIPQSQVLAPGMHTLAGFLDKGL
jgi:hypothetical protein